MLYFVYAGHGNVQDGREPLLHAQPAHGPPDLRADPLHELRVEAGAPAQRGRKDGALPDGQAGEDLLVHDRGDAEPAGGHDLLLHGGHGGP